MTFSASIKVNQDLLKLLRELPERYQRNVRRKFQTELKSELEREVNALMENGPLPVSSPWEFGTDESRLFYFFLIRSNPSLTDPVGKHWIRTGLIESGFRVTISDRLRESLIKITSVQPKSRYVFGPWIVAGHMNTGWPRQFEIARELLRTKAHNRAYAYAFEALADAAKGRDS